MAGQISASRRRTPGVRAASPRARPEPRRASRLLKKLALLTASIVLVLAVSEAAFRLFGYRPLHDVYSKPEIFWRDDPELGWSLQPGATGTYVGPRPFPIQFRAEIRINSIGLRGPEPADVPPGGSRVLLLGDSEVAGFEVAEAETYGARLAQRLTDARGAPVQVVNAGIRGYGTDQAYLLYRARLRGLRADVVVYDTSPNDPEDNTTLHRMRRPFGKPGFALRADGALRLVGSPVPDYPLCSAYRIDPDGDPQRVDRLVNRLACRADTLLADRSALFSFAVTRIRQNPDLVRSLWNVGGAQPSPAAPATPAAPGPGAAPAHGAFGDVPHPLQGAVSDHPHRVTSALISRLAAAAREDGAGFVLVGNEVDLRQLDLTAFRQEGIEIVNANEALGADQRAFRFRNDGHLTPAGHDRVAGLLAPRVAALLAR